ncbi:FHA domain-containing protein [Lyngbya confervoides]|uniref:FHA domain-containing protein n=1 Tax=Lyngbya confervoides BDU141951 TaxID=1574623 RepID=A0ABD4T2M2_9CYAN|nr:FHA domain-containing protein [Lyngbya confervoides]MCM1982695.1 FHA domain-containing protein [Lyngbya confervoides BDU141951]
MSSSDGSPVQERHLFLLHVDTTRVIQLSSNFVHVGRHPSNDIVIDCDVISRKHATFLRVPSPNSQEFDYRLIDGEPKQNQASRNGIAVNGKRCYLHLLNHGDLISFSNVIKGIYLKVKIHDDKLNQYISIISGAKAINAQTRDSIEAMTRVFCRRPVFLTSEDPTSIMLEAPQRESLAY